MKGSKYPNLKHFFSCYFNQDWDFEYTSWEETVSVYVSEVSLLDLNQTILEFSELIMCDLSVESLYREIGWLGCDIVPPGSASGLSYEEWIVLLQKELVRLRNL